MQTNFNNNFATLTIPSFVDLYETKKEILLIEKSPSLR